MDAEELNTTNANNLEELGENGVNVTGHLTVDSVHDAEATSLNDLVNTEQIALIESTFSDSYMMKYRTKFLEVIEELKMKRDINYRNEVKVQELILANHKLEQKIEEQQQKLSEAYESQVNKESEIQQKCNEKVKQIEEEKIKLSCFNEAKDKEFQSLKDEIRTLHMTKYTLEKKIGELEHTIQILTSSREGFHAQLSQLEQFCTEIEKQKNEVIQQINTLEFNVKEAVLLNRKLQYVNDHQECFISDYKEQLNNCQKDLCELKASVSKPAIETIANMERNTIQELKVQKEIAHQVESQLMQLQEEHCSVLQSLKEAHTLIDKHVENSNKSASLEADLKEEICKSEQKNDQLQEQLTSKCEELNVLKDELHDKLKSSEEMVKDLTHRLRTLQEDYSHLKTSSEEMNENQKLLKTEKDNAIDALDKMTGEVNVLKEALGEHQKIIALIKGEKSELETKLSAKPDTEDKAVEANFICKDSPRSPVLYSSPELLPASHNTPTKRTLDSESKSYIEPEPKKFKPTESSSDQTEVASICYSIVESLLEDITMQNDPAMLENNLESVTLCSTELENATSEAQNSNPKPPESESKPLCSESADCNVELIAFSDEEELMDIQMCNQIDRVQSFLKKDRLKRTKLPQNVNYKAAGLPAVNM